MMRNNRDSVYLRALRESDSVLRFVFCLVDYVICFKIT